jgi:uncharacterized iron-regulated protein
VGTTESGRRRATARSHRSALLPLLLALSSPLWADTLAERVWMPAEGRFVEPAVVERAVASARYVLLGEEHPVARHHELQARLLRAAARQRQPAVVFEMIPVSRQSGIDAWRERPDPEAAALGPAVGWNERGWPDWALYAPITEVALMRELPLWAGAPAPTELRTVARDGLRKLSAERRRALRLDRPLPGPARERLLETLRAAHCGEMHTPAERMLAAQRLRDASMAERMRASGAGGAVLIAGHGHVREDYGVPRYLDRAGDDVVTVALRTTGGTGEHIADHVAAAGGALAYDYVWFTSGRVGGSVCD